MFLCLLCCCFLLIYFAPSQTCPWFSLANHLQRHIVEGTRQTIDDLVRIFGQVELSYFHRTFFGGASMVSVDSFIEFWKWYGKAVHKVSRTRLSWDYLMHASDFFFLLRFATQSTFCLSFSMVTCSGSSQNPTWRRRLTASPLEPSWCVSVSAMRALFRLPT